VKCKRRQEFVVGGFTAPRASRSHFGALLIGLHDARGQLRYAGKVGTGFSAASLEEIHERLLPLVQATPPFVDPPRRRRGSRVKWIAPRLLAQIRVRRDDRGRPGAPIRPSRACATTRPRARGAGAARRARRYFRTAFDESSSSRASIGFTGGGRTRRGPSARGRGPGR